MKTRLSPPHRDAAGKTGVRVQIDFDRDDGGWAGAAHFDTHGMTPAEVRQKHAAIQQEHRKKCNRLDGFAKLRGPAKKKNEPFDEILDLIIRPRGEDHELLIVFRAGWRRVEIQKVFNSIDALPSDEEILAMIRLAAVKHAAADQEENDHAAAVAAIVR